MFSFGHCPKGGGRPLPEFFYHVKRFKRKGILSFLEDVGLIKVVSEFSFRHPKCHFCHVKIGHFCQTQWMVNFLFYRECGKCLNLHWCDECLVLFTVHYKHRNIEKWNYNAAKLFEIFKEHFEQLSCKISAGRRKCRKWVNLRTHALSYTLKSCFSINLLQHPKNRQCGLLHNIFLFVWARF